MANYKSNEPCVACGSETENGVSYHHIYTRGAYPELADKPWNKISLCDLTCHVQGVHMKGMNYMVEKYPNVKRWLEENEWEKDSYSGKWIHEK